MSELNQYALSRFLGSKMKPINAPTFGHFGLLETVAESLQARSQDAPRSRFTVRQERQLARSFERIREGAAPDALLCDPGLAARFAISCKESGLDFPQHELVRRILAIRKNPARFARLGIHLTPATKRESYPTMLAEYAPIVEFALVRLRYRHGSSIDEILLDPDLGAEFENIARPFFPKLEIKALRQTALSLRKSRFVRQSRMKSLRKLRPAILERKWSAFQSIAAPTTQIPAAPGLIEFRENDRDLYISRNSNLNGMLQLLTAGHGFAVMEGPFWRPKLHSIQVRFISASDAPPENLESWELKLLCERRPVFNWPIAKKAA